MIYLAGGLSFRRFGINWGIDFSLWLSGIVVLWRIIYFLGSKVKEMEAYFHFSILWEVWKARHRTIFQDQSLDAMSVSIICFARIINGMKLKL